MIEKITDIGNLSGVSSPLLPLIYAEGFFSQNELDGAFLQKSEDEEIQAVFSLKNTCVTLVILNSDATDELSTFFNFFGVTEILSDKPVMQFSNKQKELELLFFCGGATEQKNHTSINPESTIDEYNGIYNVVFENADNFEKWFPEFSKKVNLCQAFGTYFKVDNEIVSAAISPAFYKNAAVIAGVFTLEKFRNKGYATRCVNGLVNELIENNATKIYLWCESDKVPFYQKLGFKAIDKIYFGECK